MQTNKPGPYKAGDPVTDLCRACKTVRDHTVVAADAERRILRVICDYCGSQHNYRGGDVQRSPSEPQPEIPAPPRIASTEARKEETPMMDNRETGSSDGELETLLRKIIREETGLTPVTIADKWRGGEMVLQPGRENLQEKTWPIDTFFHKIVMLRNRLRVLEQQINGSDIPDDLKLKLQGYITGCYGTLTSFNILFAEEEDRFRGSSGND